MFINKCKGFVRKTIFNEHAFNIISFETQNFFRDFIAFEKNCSFFANL